MTTHATRTRLTTYASLAATAASAAVGGTADASTVVNTALDGTVIGWNTGAGQTPSAQGIGLDGPLFNIRTRANASGLAGGGGFGVLVEGANFQTGGLGFRGALLAGYGAAQGTNRHYFANVNRGSTWGFNDGNAAFSGTSKYLLFNFTVGVSTYYGWIEILATTTGVSGVPRISNYSATLGRWAYDTEAGYQLAAGQIRASAIPGGTGLAALAIGAAGLRGRRRSRN